VDAGVTLNLDGATDAGPTLTQNDGVLLANGTVLLHGGFLDFEGGAITGAFTVDGAQIYTDPGVTETSQIRVVGAGNLLLDNGSASTTLLVQGDDSYNQGVLNVAPDATNAGTIQLDSASGYWGSLLVLQDMLDNLPGGSILVTPGAGGGRSIVGDIDNEGLLQVASGEAVTINGASDAGPTFIQDGGLIQADGQLILDGGLFDFESGDVAGQFLVYNAQIYVGPDATEPATVYVVGADDTLLGNEGPSVTLQVQGDNGFGQGVLTAAAGAVNAGSIVLDSTSNYFGSALAAPQTLLNASGGLIAVADDAGGSRSLIGDFINAGTVFVSPDQQLSLDGASGAGPTLIQSGGLIAAAGPLVQDGVLFDFESGGVLGSFLVHGAQIYVGPDVTAPNTIEVVGADNVLLDNASPATTLWLQGNDAYTAGVLTAAPGAFNAGTIDLASDSVYWGETLAAPDGLVNLSGGRIAVYGGGGPPALSGTLTNDGYLSLTGVGGLSIDVLINHGTVGVDATGTSLTPGMVSLSDASAAESRSGGSGGTVDAAADAPANDAANGVQLYLTRLTVGAWTNDGTIALDPGTQLQVAPDGSGRDTFTQAGGLVSADGEMIIDGGLFHFTGGALMGDFSVRNGWIRVDSTVTQPSAVNVVGHEGVLLDNASAVVVLRVQGGSPVGDGDAVLTAADSSTNSGTIVLESLDGVYHGYFHVAEGRFTNTASGTIQISLPPGDAGTNAGAGSITAGTQEGDGGAVTDTTGRPIVAAYQSALDTVQSAEADDGGDLSDSGLDDPTLMDAIMAGTAGVADGVIDVADLGGDYITSGIGVYLANPQEAAGVLANDGVMAISYETESSLTANLPALEVVSGAPPGLAQASPSGAAPFSPLVTGFSQAPAWNGGSSSSGGGGPSDTSTQDLVGSLYGLVQGMANPAGLADVAANYSGVLTQMGDLAWDLVNDAGAEVTLGLNALFGTPAYNPDQSSSFMQGVLTAGQHNQLWSYLGNTASSAVWNLASLPGRAYNAADTAWQTFQSTGSLTPLVQWAATYGVALDGLGTGALAVVEGGAGLLQAADAGAAEAEATGASAWAGAAEALGVPSSVMDFLADDCGAVDLDKFGLGGLPSEVTAELAAQKEVMQAVEVPLAPVEAAGAQLAEALQSAETTVEQTAAAADAADAGQLAQAEMAAAQDEAAAAETGGTPADTTAVAESLEEQTAAAQTPPAATGTQALLQQLTNQAVADLQANPGLAKGLMSQGSYNQLVNNTGLAAATFGKAVERQLAELVQQDPALNQIVTHTGLSQGPNGQFISSPDFTVNEGGVTTIYDVTTPGQVPAHVIRYGNQAVIYLNYTRPPGIVFPP
ncbi:MAG TPA: hypothetical protein VMS17_17115, partial [Gemmataceae bacterium]|nr:hypothetical protein [Gemmataceae bacterium]